MVLYECTLFNVLPKKNKQGKEAQGVTRTSSIHLRSYKKMHPR